MPCHIYWLSCLVVCRIGFQEISAAMALELGESLLENMLGLNVSTDSDEEEPLHMGDCRTSSLGDEFFHSKSEYGVSSGKWCQLRPKFLSLLVTNPCSLSVPKDGTNSNLLCSNMDAKCFPYLVSSMKVTICSGE